MKALLGALCLFACTKAPPTIPPQDPVSTEIPGAPLEGSPVAALPAEPLPVQNLYFEFNVDTLTKVQVQFVIPKIGKWMDRNGSSRIMLTGHADTVGSEEYNVDLSLRRSWAVRRAIIDYGVHPDRIDMEGLGEAQNVRKVSISKE